MFFIGVDLGTSAVKLLLMDENGKIHKIVSKEYPLYFPHPGWSEQKPEDWFEQSMAGLKELIAECDKSQVKGISFGGQMHGLVALDQDDNVIRPAILWNDGRTGKQVEYLNNTIGKEKLSKYTANIAFAGFTAPKILWMKENEPDNFARIVKIMLPKDYLAYKLSGSFCTEYSDASGMLLLDVEHKCWSKEMMEICGITEEQLPKLYESWEPVGCLKPEIAEELDVTFRLEHRERFLSPVKSSAWMRTMHSIHLHMQTEIIISWDVCSARRPVISGGWMRSLRRQIILASSLASQDLARTMCSICRI